MTRKMGRMAVAAVMALAVCSVMADDNSARSAKLHTELSAQYFQMRQFAVAIDEAKTAVKADSDYAPAYNMLGLIYAELKETEQADQYFRRAAAVSPGDSDVNHNYGLFLCRRERTSEGLKYFAAALKNPLYRTPEKTWVASADCKRRSGDLTGAQEDLLQALQLRSDYAPALASLAGVSFQVGAYADARTYFGRLFQVADPYPEALWQAAQTERKLGNSQAESRYIAQLKRQFPDSKEAALAANGRTE